MFARILSGLAVLLLLCDAAPAIAAGTDWQDMGGGRARMIAELDPSKLHISGVVEIELQPGWKTYWREPGGSGIPPQFDFSGSKHFLPGEIGFPVPQLLEAGGSVFAGYENVVRFTFDGMFTTAAADGNISLELLAGICEEICIPATASFHIEFSQLQRSDPVAAGAVSLASASIPRQPEDTFRIVAAQVDTSPAMLRIEARVPAGDEEPALFVEGPSGWYLTPARLLEAQDTSSRFELDLTDIPSDADPAATPLRYTLVKGDRGIEQWVTPR